MGYYYYYESAFRITAQHSNVNRCAPRARICKQGKSSRRE